MGSITVEELATRFGYHCNQQYGKIHGPREIFEN